MSTPFEDELELVCKGEADGKLVDVGVGAAVKVASVVAVIVASAVVRLLVASVVAVVVAPAVVAE